MRQEVGRWGGVRAAVVGVLVAGTAGVLAACGSSGGDADVAAGKQLFVSKCGSCHTLGRAGTKGTVGPNLDQAFQQAIKDGLGRNGIEGAVKEQIAHPRANSQMPAGLVKGDGAVAVAEYVATSTARGGQDTGRLAEAVKKAGGGAPAVAKSGTLEIDTDKTGQLAYVTDRATATAGKLTVESKNDASIPHDIVIDGKGNGAEVQGGGVSKFSATFAKGTYTFYCSVPGHRQAGMVGKLTVK